MFACPFILNGGNHKAVVISGLGGEIGILKDKGVFPLSSQKGKREYSVCLRFTGLPSTNFLSALPDNHKQRHPLHLIRSGSILCASRCEGTKMGREKQGVFVHDEEVNRIAQYVKTQACPHYDDAFIQLKDLQNQGGEVSGECLDPLYEQVKSFVIQSRRASTSLIQRKFSVGYSRAARLIDALEEQGIIGPANGSKPRAILVKNTLEDSDEE